MQDTIFEISSYPRLFKSLLVVVEALATVTGRHQRLLEKVTPVQLVPGLSDLRHPPGRKPTKKLTSVAGKNNRHSHGNPANMVLQTKMLNY